jgi:hypothetical protein
MDAATVPGMATASALVAGGIAVSATALIGRVTA